MLVEALHLAYTVYTSLFVQPCHYPSILWLRVPDMLHAVYLLLRSLRLWCGKVSRDPFRGSTKIKVTAWIPVMSALGEPGTKHEGDEGAEVIVNKQGRWRIKKGEILLATSKKIVAVPGAMRVPFDMKDPDMVSPMACIVLSTLRVNPQVATARTS